MTECFIRFSNTPVFRYSLSLLNVYEEDVKNRLVASTSGLIASAGMFSVPAVLPFLIYLIAPPTFSIVLWVKSAERSVCCASVSGGFGGAGLLKYIQGVLPTCFAVHESR